MLSISNSQPIENSIVLSHERRTPPIVIHRIEPISGELPPFQGQLPKREFALRQTTQNAVSVVLAGQCVLPITVESYDRQGTLQVQSFGGNALDLKA